MKLTLAQTAQLFGVNENAVTRWVQQENLPVYETNSQYRFDSTELLEWAALRRTELSPAFFQSLNGVDFSGLSLAAAIARGGVAPGITGTTRGDVFRAALADVTLPPGVSRESLCDLLVLREKAGGTAIGDGIAIPHPRYPLVFPGQASFVRTCYLQHSLNFHAPDHQPVHTLFIMICGTVHEHLQLLARLVGVLRTDVLRKLMATNPGQAELCRAVKAAESTFVALETPKSP